ncbi:toll/interleukin-1 receptor domain-containing protein [Salmonirosea aquatica]|uniref:TIR domain-containing protein n=1 Tax=Salmonirosea aquatica TaxID=2654236 RepID=A0A7C9BE17_9BACT|nr:TIR domain-containing protein [Cytophagaceae bacterium SJW1-29]
MSKFKNGIFISYSHRDKEWLNKLMIHLKPLIRNEKIRVWDDTQIQPGANWREEITNAIEESRIALLLVSPNFLASDFIMENELPQILKDAYEGNTIIYWVAVSYSAYDFTKLKEIQSVNSPNKPLDSLPLSEQNKELVEIAKRIANGVEVNVVSNFLHVIDEFVPQQKAFLDKAPVDERERKYSIQAHQSGDKIELISGEYTVETIRAEDFDRLDQSSKQLIRSYERTMKDLFDRWTELQPKSYSRDEYLKVEARKEMGNIRTDLCRQLNAILDYLNYLGKNLEDHYHHVRYLCSQSEK